MEEKARRLRGFPREGRDCHVFNLYLDKAVFRNFRAQCIIDGVTVREKLISMIESSLS
jgi:hypothetical protein|tara:strand:- start:7731 stop:7904 length:174 start_codon:yes stop_codon:yes gene_type:complete